MSLETIYRPTILHQREANVPSHLEKYLVENIIPKYSFQVHSKGPKRDIVLLLEKSEKDILERKKLYYFYSLEDVKAIDRIHRMQFDIFHDEWEVGENYLEMKSKNDSYLSLLSIGVLKSYNLTNKENLSKSDSEVLEMNLIISSALMNLKSSLKYSKENRRDIFKLLKI